MSGEKVLITLLESIPAITDLVSDRVFPGRLDKDTVLPAVNYAIVNDRPNVVHSGYTGFSFQRFDIGIFTSSYTMAVQIRDAIRAYFLTLTPVQLNVTMFVNRVIINNQYYQELDQETLRAGQHAMVLDVSLAYREG